MNTNDKIVFSASAPGRLDVMGGIADYSGSLVLQLPIAQCTHVQLILRDDNRCTFTSTVSTGETFNATLEYSKILSQGEIDYIFAKKILQSNPQEHWISYIIGCALVLQKERGIHFTGADFIIHSDVPLGKGVSSSASIEVATMKALSKAFNLNFEGTELPRLAQRVENLIAGAPCGLMDQLASYFGEPDKLLPIVCQPDKIETTLPLPDGIKFIGIDSGVRHSVSGASYSDVRCAAFMGYSIIAQLLGVDISSIQRAKERSDFSSLPFGGYLCNIPVEKFNRSFLSALPQSITGETFLKRYQVSTDSVTQIDPDKSYAIRQCTSHPVYEHARVLQFKNYLQQIAASNHTEKVSLRNNMGDLMYQSHLSYSLCGLGSDRTDEIVAMTKNYKGIYGAKITGGGNGGTVCLLTDDEGAIEAKKIHQRLCDEYQADLAFFS
jgi:L-arabinokinase